MVAFLVPARAVRCRIVWAVLSDTPFGRFARCATSLVSGTADSIICMLFVDWKFTLHDNDSVNENSTCQSSWVHVAELRLACFLKKSSRLHAQGRASYLGEPLLILIVLVLWLRTHVPGSTAYLESHFVLPAQIRQSNMRHLFWRPR